MKKRLLASLLAVIMCIPMFACDNNKGKSTDFKFVYPNATADALLGSKTNNESYDYSSLKVQPVQALRDDFIMGVDASMVHDVEINGGVYYNKDGKEQDVFKILASHGVNFFRVRVWNDPTNLFGEKYGGGDNTVAVGVELAKRAQNAGMNVLVDFHYSDFWADPESQDMPKDWGSYDNNELADAVGNYTKNSLNAFKAAGVNVAMVQIGNEINNGMLFPAGEIVWGGQGEIDSFDFISKVLSSGVKGAKSVFPNIYSAIHLANGGNQEEFDVFFSHLKRNNVPYDAIGVSYYPYYHGTLQALQSNLNHISQKFDKHVFVAELSYGFTNAHNENTANIYSSATEDAGKYLTSIQGQATAIRDVINTVASVPNQKGVGVFYWEPAWLPVAGSGWANPASGRTDEQGLNTWANQGLFSYTGKALPSLDVFSLVRGSGQITEKPLKLRYNEAEYTINIADSETLPSTVAVETDLDAIRQLEVTWNKTISQPGVYNDIVGTVEIEGLSENDKKITAVVNAIRNFVKDPGFEKQGITDNVVAPWVVSHNSTGSEKIVKLDRKTDMRSGATDLNWYHSSLSYSFTVEQTITGLENGEYELSVFAMAPNSGAIKNTKIEVFIEYNNGETKTYDLTDKVVGWGNYIEAKISGIMLTTSTAKIGIKVTAPARAWGHVDDWALIKL